MNTITKMVFCKGCKKMTQHFQQVRSGLMMLLGALFTFGLSLLFTRIGGQKPQCSICGSFNRA